MASKFGEYLKKIRLRNRVSLRAFCLKNNFDPGNYSKLERGQYSPPHNPELITKYANALGLLNGSDEWLELFDLASAERGELPADLMSDEEVVSKLPILFRTLRASQISDENLDNLVERIRRS